MSIANGNSCSVWSILQLLTVREIPYSELQFGDIVGVGGQGAVFKGNWKTRSLSVAIKRVLGKIRHEEVSFCVTCN